MRNVAALLVVSVSAAGLMAACSMNGGSTGTAQPSTSALPVSTAVAVGVLEGDVLLYGGPYRAKTASGGTGGDPGVLMPVQVENSDGSSVVATSDRKGHFRVELPAGTYTLQCRDKPIVTISVGSTTTADCIKDVP